MKVLFIEDESGMIALFRAIARACGVSIVHFAETLPAATEVVVEHAHDADVVFLDGSLHNNQNLNTAELIGEIKSRGNARVVAISDRHNEALLEAGADEAIRKGDEHGTFTQSVISILKRAVAPVA